ncbi:aminotransferase class I/II-fold pyridoxal phosphate-dependent enzyme [Leptospira licerasiae]|uniref:8-amino-7-oxononanoate synthase n=1 Tax=Leptospira licerasiae str. MMD4847 TaxID=1049971 RepID=A0ABP2RJJ2_9LEPT|nr:8-amino-7-oxononanoate synthase [Leptospira licerasiae]EIE01532.1 putative 8-amino-7-oxononanoate synthase [Leptospira licerasiae serovar Varillal str. VAR 010]EJZ43629.1 putative 8-amino-7-oxononanoate synthase [Leptospira licerasiae str. MMD4847]
MQETQSSKLPFFSELPAFFSRLESQNRIRTLDPPSGLDLCSNDYLGLSTHPEVIQALKEGIDIYGAGSTASRLVRGHRTVFEELENDFSDWVQSEDSLFFANGYAANLGTISCVADPSYTIFCDRKNHASLMDGVRLSGAKKVYYKHSDLNDLENSLKKYSGTKHKMIVTESVFSMDGDKTDISALIDLKEKYGALLYLDEAHAIGLFGKDGAGVSLEKSISRSSEIDFRMSTLGKALGLEGAVISTSKDARKYLLHSARTFVFSTGPLPAIAHAGRVAIRLAKLMNKERSILEENSEFFRTSLHRIGYNTGNSNTQIIPILMGSEEQALELSSILYQNGFQAKAIRPPTVDISRIRVSLNSKIARKDLEKFIQLVREN